MDNKKAADLLGELIGIIKENSIILRYCINDERIAYVEGVIKELREEEMKKAVTEILWLNQ